MKQKELILKAKTCSNLSPGNKSSPPPPPPPHTLTNGSIGKTTPPLLHKEGDRPQTKQASSTKSSPNQAVTLQVSKTSLPPPEQVSLNHKEPLPSSSRSRKVLFKSTITQEMKELVKDSPIPECDDKFESLNDADESVLKPVVVTDEIRKEQFLRGLGLVTKEALSELQNKKSVRKRRTTANPHFSHEAIEAKRITQLEAKAIKAKRRELMKTRYALKADAAKRRQTVSSVDDDPGERRPGKRLSTDSKEKEKAYGSSRVATGRATNSSVLQSRSNRLTAITERPSAISKECAICSEMCDCDLEPIMFCFHCYIFFHITCQGTAQELANYGFVSCPKCDDNQPLEEQVNDMESIISRYSSPSPSNFAKREKGVKHRKKAPTIAALLKQNENQPKAAMPSHVVVTHDSHPFHVKKESTKQSFPKVKREPQEPAPAFPIKETVLSIKEKYEKKLLEAKTLMEKKTLLQIALKERKEQYTQTRNSYLSLKDRNASLTKENQVLKGNIDRLVGFVKSVQVWDDIIDSDEQRIPSSTSASSNAPETSVKKEISTSESSLVEPPKQSNGVSELVIRSSAVSKSILTYSNRSQPLADIKQKEIVKTETPLNGTQTAVSKLVEESHTSHDALMLDENEEDDHTMELGDDIPLSL